MTRGEERAAGGSDAAGGSGLTPARPRHWRAIARGLADLLLPRACAVCREPLVSHADGLVCGVCWARCVALTAPQCPRCGHPRRPLPAGADARLGTGAPARPAADAGDGFARCTWCDRLPAIVRAARSAAWVHVGTGGAIVHALKYDGWSALAPAMGARMARLAWPPDVVAERAAVVPVPLAPVRERERGFNQAALLARAVAAHWDIPHWPDALVRTRATRSQTRLTPSERAGNVSHAFAVPEAARARLVGRHVVLVDDVLTTAATLNAAAVALAAGGVRIVSYVTFGRAPDPGDAAAHASPRD